MSDRMAGVQRDIVLMTAVGQERITSPFTEFLLLSNSRDERIIVVFIIIIFTHKGVLVSIYIYNCGSEVISITWGRDFGVKIYTSTKAFVLWMLQSKKFKPNWTLRYFLGKQKSVVKIHHTPTSWVLHAILILSLQMSSTDRYSYIWLYFFYVKFSIFKVGKQSTHWGLNSMTFVKSFESSTGSYTVKMWQLNKTICLYWRTLTSVQSLSWLENFLPKKACKLL